MSDALGIPHDFALVRGQPWPFMFKTISPSSGPCLHPSCCTPFRIEAKGTARAISVALSPEEFCAGDADAAWGVPQSLVYELIQRSGTCFSIHILHSQDNLEIVAAVMLTGQRFSNSKHADEVSSSCVVVPPVVVCHMEAYHFASFVHFSRDAQVHD